MNEVERVCPLCGVSFSDFDGLQQHVQLHSDLEKSPTQCHEVPSCSDQLLAEALHAEEVQNRHEAEMREKEDFLRLQRQYGLDGSGSFVHQEVTQMEREVARGVMTPSEFHNRRSQLLESLAEGIDDGASRTDGLMAAINHAYEQDHHPAGLRASWIAAETSHYRAGPGDVGWGCGYRNLQMLLSCLARLQHFDCLGFQGGLQIPSLPRLQELVEEAWTKGFDPMGASSLGGRLRNTRAWIGSTEIYSFLSAQGVSCRLVDFHRPSGSAGTHPRLLQWVLNYFCSNTISPAGQVLCQTRRPPLYLQHQGLSHRIPCVHHTADPLIHIAILHICLLICLFLFVK
uniref:zinc finger-containing ubiquitin peptidase 1 isoform X2 n=1 Tax=Myxine glutinosa TaxID=7769 RepID=UPI00358E1950